MNSVLFQNRIVLLQLQSLRRVLAVLGGDVAAHPRLTCGLMLGAFQNNLNPVAFLCHDSSIFITVRGFLLPGLPSKPRKSHAC
jgi:hypothetical protein